MDKNSPRLKKNMPLLITLTVSAASIYFLAYLRSFYYDAFIAAFGLTNEESGMAGAAFGLFGAVSYLIGGLLADKISIKILIPGSMLVTGGLGLVLLANPSAEVIIAIHGVWGITSLMTFWPANVKALRLCGNDAEQGKVFGFFEGGRGVTNAAVYAVAAALFAAFFTAQSQMSGIREIIMLYSGIPIAMGIANIFLLRGIDESNPTSANSGIDLKLVGKVLKDPKVWLMSLIILCAYTVNMGNYYIGSYTTAAFSMTALGAAVISSSSQYIRPFAAGGAGIIADKINASKVMMLGLLLSAIGLGIIYIAPEGGNVIIVLVGTVIVFISMFMTQSMHFAMMGEHEFTPEATGTIIGIACTIGYLPEFFLAPMVGRILDTYQNSPEGYRMVFILLIGFVVVGMLLTALWMKDTKVRRAEILAEKKAAEKKA